MDMATGFGTKTFPTFGAPTTTGTAHEAAKIIYDNFNSLAIGLRSQLRGFTITNGNEVLVAEAWANIVSAQALSAHAYGRPASVSN